MILTLAILIAAGAVAAAFYFWKKTDGLETELSAKNARISSLNSASSAKDTRITNLNTEVDALKKGKQEGKQEGRS